MIRIACLLFLVGVVPCLGETPSLLREKEFDCRSLAQAVNYFVDLGEKDGIGELKSLTKNWGWGESHKNGFDVNERIGWICRIVFEPKESTPLREGRFGGHGNLPEMSMPADKWPVLPLVRSRESLFVLDEGYFLAGYPEDLISYIEYCEESGKFRTQRVPLPTRDQAQRDVESLRQSEPWKSLKWTDCKPGNNYSLSEERVFEFIKSQADRTSK